MPSRVLFMLLTLILVVASARSSFAQDTIIELTNADIVTMVKAKLPQELIITKIKSFRCRFDTFPSVLSELKYKGVALTSETTGARISLECGDLSALCPAIALPPNVVIES